MRGLFFLWTLILLAGCSRHHGSGESTVQLPADSIIPREVMVKIAADVHVLEAALLKKRYDRKNTKMIAGSYYKELFSKYRITELRYRRNIDRLQENTRDFMAFYNEVIAELDTRISAIKKAADSSVIKE